MLSTMKQNSIEIISISLQEIAKQTTTKNFSKITKKSSQNMGRSKNYYKDQ